MDQTPVKLPMSFNIQVNDEQREVFMSFALLNRLSFLIGDVTNLPLVQTAPEMRTIILNELLAERTKSGREIKKLNLDELDIPLEHIQGLLDFACEHVLDFTLGAIEKSTALHKRNATRLLSLKSTQDGLVASASKSLPASPSTQPQVNSTETSSGT